MAAMAGYTKRPSWQLPATRNRPPLAVWASDDRLGTFIAGHPNAPPLAGDIYKLRLLDQEDEQSAEDQQQSGEVSTMLQSFLGLLSSYLFVTQWTSEHIFQTRSAATGLLRLHD